MNELNDLIKVKNSQRQRKKEIVSMIRARYTESEEVIFFDYSQISHMKLEELRKELKQFEATMLVAKNSLIGKAFSGVWDAIKTTGSTAIVFCYRDVPQVARILKKYGTMKLGTWNSNRLLDQKELEYLASLPSREILLAKMAGSLLSSITRYAILLTEIGKTKGVTQ